ncbi:armadillo-type protein, partial [Pisolithus marmoratus]
MHIAQTILLSSSTKLRLRFIQEELQWLANEQQLSLSQTMDVFKLLTQTYPRYIDTPSREAVEAMNQEPDCKLGITEQIVDWLVHEVSSFAKPGIVSSYAPADAFVLLSWACGLYILVCIIAVLVDFQLNPSTHSKSTMQSSALVRTRRALRSAPDRLTLLMSTLVAQASPVKHLSRTSPARYSRGRDLPLKNVKDDSLRQINPAIKGDIVALYTSFVLMSKGPVSPHTSNALHDFIQSCVDPTVLSSSVLPTMEKALLRSPEYSLSVARDFFLAYSHLLDIATFKKLLTSCLSSAKSSNATTRANTSALFKVIVSKVPADALGSAVPEILALPQAGKTTGPDHRATLYTMLSVVQPSPGVSPFIVKALPPLILKETSDISIAILASTSHPTSPKEMANAKPALRKSFVSIVGATLWNLPSLNSEPAITFVNSIKGSLETNLKSVSMNPLGAAAGLLEGYVALAVLLGPMSKSGQFADLVARNTSVEIIAGTPTKPSFLVWEKLYQRLGDREKHLVIEHLETELLKNENLSVHSPSFETRRIAIHTLESAVSRQPNLVPILIKESLLAALTKDKSLTTSSKLGGTAPPPPSTDDWEKPAAVNEQRRYATLLLACAADCAALASLWIEMCQKAGCDPHDLVQKHINSVMTTVIEASMVDPKLGFADASYVVMPRIMGQLRADIDVQSINDLTETDFEIYETPEGTTYTDGDVVSNKKEEGPKKGKDADIAKWEADQGARATAALSKQAQALLQAQLDKEAAVRCLQRALAFVKSVVSANDLARCCSERLDTTRKWVGVAIFRALQFPCIPETLVLRVLYRLRTISQQAPFDAATFSYAFPLLARVLHQGGIDVSEDDEVLNKSHSSWTSSVSNINFPRKAAMEHLIIHPSDRDLRRNISIDSRDAQSGDPRAKLMPTSHSGKVHMPLDLTDLDWSPELWIACHDEDARNAHLANHVWEDNGLDFGSSGRSSEQTTGHVNAYARASSAFAIADAVGHLPQTSEKTIVALQDLYRDKAKILAPEYDGYGMVIPETLNRPDPWPTRVAIASVFEQLAPVFPDTEVEAFIRFLIKDEALGDRSSEVRRGILQAGTAVVDHHGSARLTEAVVILFGRAARHLEASDPRIRGMHLDTFVDRLFDELFNAPKYAARRGAAYGLAGAIKGLGIGSMKRFDDKKRFELRQGTMFAFETLSTTLGRLFEPYITFILPLLLFAFGDGTADVREAAQDAARYHGQYVWVRCKTDFAILLSGLDEKQWRSKKGSIELLGMMAYCSPRQLSLSLPIVIPRLTSVLTDTHAQSLKQFGEVINNPEIQALVPTLLKALVDPAKTTNALSSLLKTSFVHYIDHSSLALVIPVIERGLRERAAQIVGNLASLTDSKDFVPYLSTLLPMVQVVLVDPVPEARATAAKTLGVLVERLGEAHFPDLVPGLLRTLKAETSGVDRQGAAQGLEGLLPDIIANAQSPRSTIREGFMSLLVYLPATGLADSEEYVREAAMRAGRMIVVNYSAKAIDLLLPELEQGMFDPGWRIRQSSITLVGELLFKVSGISGKTEIGNEEEGGTKVLGEERRDRILSALYVARQDAVNVVRQSSIHIWKALVHNTPRTVRGILPELVNQLIKLYWGREEQQEVQTDCRSQTLELCRKFGEKLVGEIVTILKNMSG